MKSFIRNLFLVFITSFAYQWSWATHLVGADMTYECIGNNVYEVTLNVYRDCGPNNTTGTGFDDNVTIHFYNDATDSIYTAFAIFDGNVSGVDFTNTDPCLVVPPELCIEKGSYYFTITVPDSTLDYTVNYQRCCFGPNVGNIEDSQLMGINISTKIPAASFSPCYSSPTFNSDPLLAMCLQEPLTEDLGATSQMNMPGTLEYSFFTPYTGASAAFPVMYSDVPYTLMEWENGYSATYPIESNPPLALNSVNGELTGVVSELGYYVMGTKINIKDNTNNTVGHIERVFKYTVADCSAGEHIVDIDSELGSNIQICNGDPYTFQVANNTTASQFEWWIDGTLVSNDSVFTHVFNQDGEYDVVLYGIADSADCYEDGSFSQTVTVFSLDLGIEANRLICAGELNKFEDTTELPPNITYEVIEWLWNFGDGQTSTSENPQHTYSEPGLYDITLHVIMDNGCEATIVKENYIEVYDVDIDLESLLEVCVNSENPFTSSVVIGASEINPAQSFLWDFGDGQTSDEPNPEHSYDEVGVYDVSLQVELETGCTYYIEYPNHITVIDDHIDSDIEVISDTLYYPFSDPILIETTSNNFDSIAWSIDNEYVGSENNLSYVLGESYNEEEVIVQAEFFEDGCSKVKTAYLPANYSNHLFIPNAFTPNGDGTNEGFKPVGRIVEHAEYYKFSIYNRYGQQYFSSTDHTEYWKGLNKKDVEVEQGIYVWTLEILTKHSGNYSMNGVVTLIK